MALVWDEALFTSHYEIRIRDPAHPNYGEILHYTRAGMARAMDPYTDTMDLYIDRWNRLTTLFSIPQTDRIFVIGAGFGWLIEAAKDAGWPNVFGIDNSPYISARKNEQSLPGQAELRGDVILVERDFTGGGAVKAAVRQATGDDEFHWVISEDVAHGLDDTELTIGLNFVEDFLYATEPQSQIIHFVTPSREMLIHGTPVIVEGDPGFFWRLLSTYKSLRPAHTWIDIGTWEVAV